MSIVEIENIKNRFKNFMNGTRVVMLIDRGIQNTNKGSRRWINKIITNNETEWINAIEVLLDMQKYINEPDVRLYACINDRKLDNAILMFKHKQLDILDTQEVMKIKFYSKINDSFCSCLMKPENKKSKYFLLDIDTKSSLEVDQFVSDHLIQVVMTYPTQNGWHYIVEPFNIMFANGKEIFTVIKDGLMLIKYLDDQGLSYES